jgi:hypothetical protein
LIVFFALSGIACGQNAVEVGFGVRGGLVANGSVQANQLCVDTACAFGTPSFAANNLPGTLGPAVNVLLHDRVEIRFEAVHRRFGYQTDQTLFSFVGTTQGTLWEYPLLATYHFSSGSIRPFAGGGMSIGITGISTTETVTPTSAFRTSGSLSNWAPYYLVAGIDGRISHVSIKPEFRYSHFSVDQNSDAVAVLKPNQFEFLVGVSVQSVLKKLDTHH